MFVHDNITNAAYRFMEYIFFLRAPNNNERRCTLRTTGISFRAAAAAVGQTKRAYVSRHLPAHRASDDFPEVNGSGSVGGGVEGLLRGVKFLGITVDRARPSLSPRGGNRWRPFVRGRGGGKAVIHTTSCPHARTLIARPARISEP